MSEPTRIEVTTCAACPFMRYQGERDRMLCERNGRAVEGYPEDPPDWCPLRKSDHLVTLRVK